MKYYKTELLIKTEKKFSGKWDKEDECVYNAYKLLMYVLHKRLNRKNKKIEEQTDNPFYINLEEANKESLFKYFKTLINEITEKSNENNCQKYNLAQHYEHDDFVHQSACDGNAIIFLLDNYGKRRESQKAIKRKEAIAEAKKKQREKEQMLKKAKEMAKAELLQEQEEARKLVEAEEETKVSEVVIPLKNYGKLKPTQ
jgi:hypothetical protein